MIADLAYIPSHASSPLTSSRKPDMASSPSPSAPRRSPSPSLLPPSSANLPPRPSTSTTAHVPYSRQSLGPGGPQNATHIPGGGGGGGNVPVGTRIVSGPPGSGRPNAGRPSSEILGGNGQHGLLSGFNPKTVDLQSPEGATTFCAPARCPCRLPLTPNRPPMSYSLCSRGDRQVVPGPGVLRGYSCASCLRTAGRKRLSLNHLFRVGRRRWPPLRSTRTLPRS